MKISRTTKFLLASKEVSFFPLAATLAMTEFNPTTLLAYSSLACTAGRNALFLPFSVFISMIVYTLCAAKKWKAFNKTCPSEFFYDKYGNVVGFFSSLVLLVSMLGLSATYIKSIHLLLFSLLPNTSNITVYLIICSISLMVLLAGGLKTLIRTDIVSIIFCAFIIGLAAFENINLEHFCMLSINNLESVSFKQIFAYSILSSLSYMLMPGYSQKIFAAKNTKTAFLSSFGAALIVFVFYELSVISALFYKNSLKIQVPEQQVLTYMLTALPFVGGVTVIVFFSVIGITTISAMWNAIAGLLLTNQVRILPASTQLHIMTFLIVICAISLTIACLISENLMDALVFLNLLMLSLSYSLIAGFYFKNTSKLGAFVSIILGSILGVYIYIAHYKNTDFFWNLVAFYQIPTIFLSGIITNLVIIKIYKK